MTELNEKQRLFCREYIVDFNITQAAIRAGYSPKTAHATGSRLLKNVKIQQEIARLKEERAERTNIAADDVVKQLAKIAFMDIKKVVKWTKKEIRQVVGVDEITKKPIYAKVPVIQIAPQDMDEVDGTVIQSIRQTKHGVHIELADRMKAMEMLAKHLGVYDERPQTTVNVDGYKNALWERAAAGDIWDGFNNDDPDGVDNGEG